MRIKIDIPKELIDEAMQQTGAQSKHQLIKDALQAQVDRAKRKRLIFAKGKINLNIDIDVTKKRQYQ